MKSQLYAQIFYTILCFATWAGIRIEVTEVPPLLLSNKPIYLASSLNNWNPGDPNYALTKQNDGGIQYRTTGCSSVF